MRRFRRELVVFFVGLASLIACGTDVSDEASPTGPMTTPSSTDPNDSSGSTSSAPGGNSKTGDGDAAAPIDAMPPVVMKECTTGAGCASGVCSPEGNCLAPTSTDNVKNGTETDVDCGGAAAPICGPTKRCLATTDCDSGVCTGGSCQAPEFNDGVKNGTETDVDCGGAGTNAATKCDVGKTCSAHGDCKSDGCGDDNKCADYRGCTALHGGRTCGGGESGDAAATHESCCAEAAVPTRPGVMVDKYLITAGRMRAFVDRVGGNVRDAVKDNPKWVGAWTSYMPTNMTEALAQLGPWAQDWEWPPPGVAALPRTTWAARGCSVSGFGARTYWQPPVGAEANVYSQDALDEKTLNCVTAAMLHAMCLWEGKDLAGPADLTAAWVGGTNRKYPWGDTPAPPTNDGQNSAQVVHRFNYAYPGFISPDASIYIAAPGRRPGGNGQYGHADLAGNVIQFAHVGATTYFLNSGSWERHTVGTFGSTYTNSNNTNADTVWNRRYYAIGGRCARR